jgi:hypothetical protein
VKTAARATTAARRADPTRPLPAMFTRMASFFPLLSRR